jgi:hypothetical protein
VWEDDNEEISKSDSKTDKNVVFEKYTVEEREFWKDEKLKKELDRLSVFTKDQRESWQHDRVRPIYLLTRQRCAGTNEEDNYRHATYHGPEVRFPQWLAMRVRAGKNTLQCNGTKKYGRTSCNR